LSGSRHRAANRRNQDTHIERYEFEKHPRSPPSRPSADLQRQSPFENEEGGWSPKPAPVEPAAFKRTSCINPHGTPHPWQNVALWLHFRVRATFWPVLRSTPGRDFSDLCRWLCWL